MKAKKIVAAALSLVMALSLAACGNGSGSGSTPETSDSGSSSEGEPISIGIVQFVQHDALDAATKGFQDALTKAFGDRVSFDVQNASADATACATIANSFVSKNVDLIMANATPAVQAAASATANIPILGTSVTEYGVALDIKDFNGTVGGNISGTSDLAPLDEQAQMIVDIFPDAKTVGLLYCSAEPNSKYQVDVVKSELEGKGLTADLYAFSDANDIAAVCTSAVNSCDVIYVPTDNTAAESAGIIDGICRPAKVPVVAGEVGICTGCGTVTLSISYYDLGYKTGEMAVEILDKGADISTMKIEYAPEVTKMYNAEICEELGITVPSEYTAIE